MQSEGSLGNQGRLKGTTQRRSQKPTEGKSRREFRIGGKTESKISLFEGKRMKDRR